MRRTLGFAVCLRRHQFRERGLHTKANEKRGRPRLDRILFWDVRGRAGCSTHRIPGLSLERKTLRASNDRNPSQPMGCKSPCRG